MTTLQDVLAHRFDVPAESFRGRTDDGVEIRGARLGDASAERGALVLCHGLMGWHRKPRFARFAEALTPWFTVFVFDLRGHGRSGGVSTLGDREIEDVNAVVRLARGEGHVRVATMGMSMGGIAVVRHAALIGGVDAVVAISSLAGWGPHDDSRRRRRAWRRMRRVTETARGRRVLRAYGVRLPPSWEAPESPEEVADKIAPTPLLVVHGRDDHLFGEDQAHRLFEAASEPKRMLLAERFGHAEDGLSRAFAGRLAHGVYVLWGLAWAGDAPSTVGGGP
jgi:pimeloyl-ACP methyl ester carboxylesterase